MYAESCCVQIIRTASVLSLLRAQGNNVLQIHATGGADPLAIVV